MYYFKKFLKYARTFVILIVLCLGLIHVIAGQADQAMNAVESSYSIIKPNKPVKEVETFTEPDSAGEGITSETVSDIELSEYGFTIPQYAGEPYELVNNNVPVFSDDEFERAVSYFEDYSDLDSLGRCGIAEASFGPDTIPTKKRGDIGSIKPSGWKQAKYNGIGADGSYDPTATNYLYNRAHLLMFALGGNGGDGSDNGNLNLITGTRYMNVQGMLPFENKILNYVKDTGNRVLYRVTPVFYGNELVARGVHMECASIADKGESFSFNVYVFNIQPHITIDYRDGSSKSDDGFDVYTGKNDYGKGDAVK